MIIGIDLGGMSAKGAVLKDGELLGKTRVKTSADRSAEETAGELAQLAMQTAENAGIPFEKVQAIGIGSPGVIDSKTGTVVNWTNFSWKDVPLARIIKERTGKQVFVTNDANAAALGEAKYGAGKNYSDSVLITIGTGIGGGIILGGKLFEGYLVQARRSVIWSPIRTGSFARAEGGAVMRCTPLPARSSPSPARICRRNLRARCGNLQRRSTMWTGERRSTRSVRAMQRRKRSSANLSPTSAKAS